MRITVAAVMASLALVGLSVASESQAAVKRFTNIPTQGLGSALVTLEKDRDLEVIFVAEDIRDVRTQGAVGEFTPEETLRRLLNGTGLTYRFMDERTITILPERPRNGQGVAANGQKAEGTRKDLPNALEPKNSEAVVAGRQAGASGQEEVEPSASNGSDDIIAETSGQRDYRKDVVALPEILVEGSKSLNRDIKRSRDDVQPFVVFDREFIETSGAVDVADLLKNRLPMNAQAALPNQFGTSLIGNRSAFDLRGLGENQTTVLVDGHRLASWNNLGAAGQPDINGIPLSAIERIEVLPTTASGIYGGGATGGVINVILRRDYTGVDTKLSYLDSFDGGGANYRVDVSVGAALDEGKTNIMLSGSYRDGDSVFVNDRDIVERSRALLFSNNPAAFLSAFTPPLGATSNICSAPFGFCDGSALVLDSGETLTGSSTFVPNGYAGPASDGGQALVGNAGGYNLTLADTAQSGGRREALLAAPREESARVSIRREFAPKVHAFLEVSASKSTSDFSSNQSISGSTFSNAFLLPASAPNNPFAQDVLVTTPMFGTDSFQTSTIRDQRAIGGLIFKLSSDWTLETDLTWNRTRFSHASPPFELSADADAAVASGAIDVMRDTNVFTTDFSDYVTSSSTLFGPSETTLKEASLLAGGSLPWEFPAGEAPQLTASVARREEELGALDQAISGGPSVTNNTHSQTVDSVYLEARLPVVSQSSRIRFADLMEFLIAIRREDYSIVASNSTFDDGSGNEEPVVREHSDFSSTDPSVGLRFKPIEDLMLRASYNEGFLPPGLNQLVPNAPRLVTSFPLFGITDPLRGNELLGPAITVISGGNPELRPEQSRSKSAGFVVTPRFAPSLRFSVDWTKIDKSDNIEVLSPFNQQGLDSIVESAPERITRGDNLPGDEPGWPGPIVAINTTWINIARAEVETYDFAFDYTVESRSAGTFGLSALATRQKHLLRQITADSPVTEGAGSQVLDWRATSALTWKYRQWTFSWSTRYFDSYYLLQDHSVDPNQGEATVPSQTYHDLSIVYRLGGQFGDQGSSRGLGSRLLRGTEIQFGVENVFNKRPPIVASPGLNYSQYGNPLMAAYSISIRSSF